MQYYVIYKLGTKDYDTIKNFLVMFISVPTTEEQTTVPPPGINLYKILCHAISAKTT